MTQQRAVQPLAEAALLAALTALLGLLSLGVPPIRFLTDFLWGIPIIIIIMKHQLRLGLMALTVSIMLLLFIFDPLSVFLFAIQMSPLAVCYGILVKNKVSPGKSLIIGTLVAVLAEVLTILGFLYLAGISVIPAQEEMFRQIDELLLIYDKYGLLDIYAKQGVSKEMVKDIFYDSIQFMTLLIPATLILSAMLRALLTWVVSQRVIKRLGYEVHSLPRFVDWTLPWYWVWFLIIGLLITLAGDHYGFNKIAIVGKNTVVVVSFVYLVIGLAIATSFIKGWQLPGWLKVLIVLIAFLNLYGTLVLFILLGIFDPFIGFRRLNKQNKE